MKYILIALLCLTATISNAKSKRWVMLEHVEQPVYYNAIVNKKHYPSARVTASSILWINGGYIHFYNDTGKKAESLVKKMMRKVPNFDRTIKKAIETHGGLVISIRDVGVGYRGKASLNGKYIAITKNDIEPFVIVHELLHTLGYNHGAAMDVETRRVLGYLD